MIVVAEFFKELQRHLFFILFLLLLGSCKQKLSKPEACAFYYWQTTWQWTENTQSYCKALNVNTLYVRFFDVDWNEHEGRAVPVAPLTASEKSPALPAHIAVVPTVFITNRTVFNLKESQVEALADKMWAKIQTQAKQIFSQNALKMIQLDCDWSAETRATYFSLCKALKKRALPAQLSATIRLHQVKYPQKTGIPPVDRGVLMCYNVGKVDGSNTQNSILDIDILRSYVGSLSRYPIQLDLALPAFGWGVLKRRGAVIKLLPDVMSEKMESNDYERLSKKLFRVKKQHYLANAYLYEDDEIRLEKATPDLLEKALQELLPQMQGKKFALIYYHLHTDLHKNFSIEELQKPFQ